LAINRSTLIALQIFQVDFGPPMSAVANSKALRVVNFTIGLALLVRLSPKHGCLPEKPAGVRTAVQLLGKKQPALRIICQAAFA
jgi:hypothetical protein